MSAIMRHCQYLFYSDQLGVENLIVVLIWEAQTLPGGASFGLSILLKERRRLPWWLIGKESACNEGYVSSIPGFGRSPGGGNGNPLQYSCLGSPMDRGAWQAILLLLSCTTSLCILYNTSALANTWLAKFFSSSLNCYFHFLIFPLHWKLEVLTFKEVEAREVPLF